MSDKHKVAGVQAAAQASSKEETSNAKQEQESTLSPPQPLGKIPTLLTIPSLWYAY